MIVAIITARISSRRLPGKVLKDILGKPMLWHIVSRVKASKFINRVVIATSRNKENVAIRQFAKEYGIDYYSGSENDILDRLYKTAKKFGADTIVRVWGDCPLIDPQILDFAIDYYFANDYAYLITKGFPQGFETAITSFGVLEQARREIKNPPDREWIHKFFVDNWANYNVGAFWFQQDLSQLNYSVNAQEDLDAVRKIYEALYKEDEIFHLGDVLKL